MARPPAVIPASYSSISAYETCPKQFYETRIAKNFKQEESPQMAWGNAVHKALENHVKHNAAIPANMTALSWPLDLFAARGDDTRMYAELEVGVTEALTPSGFWDADCWVRGKIDILLMNEAQTRALNGDYKTGKTKPNSQQLTLSTLICFHNYPTLERERTVFFWLPEQDKKKRMTVSTFIREDDNHVRVEHDGVVTNTTIEALWAPFRDTIEQMKWSLEHNVWPAKPSGLCRQWCPVLTCPHNGLRK